LIAVLIISISDEPPKSGYTNTYGYQHKKFTSSSSLDGKILILDAPQTYVFEVYADMKAGYLSVTLLNEKKDKELLRIEGARLDEIKEISLDAGRYAVEIETHDAMQGKFMLKYNKK
jgi:hypothetical protein